MCATKFLFPKVPPSLAPLLTLGTAVAMHNAVERYSGLDIDIKWPNDLLIGGKKFCGILSEIQAEVDLLQHIIIGVGVNVNHENLPPELIQLAGSLERLPNETKTGLSNLFIDAADQLAREKKHCAPYLTALGFILSRAPFYAGPETVVSPDLVGRAYETFRTYDWASPELREVQSLFLRAARVVGNRNFDLPKALRHRIAIKLEKSGVAPQKTGKLKEFVPIGGSERISLHDEGLPPGLILGNV